MSTAAKPAPTMEGKELRSIADHLEKLCISAHQRYTKTIACDTCRAHALKLREYASVIDRAAGIGASA